MARSTRPPGFCKTETSVGQMDLAVALEVEEVGLDAVLRLPPPEFLRHMFDRGKDQRSLDADETDLGAMRQAVELGIHEDTAAIDINWGPDRHKRTGAFVQTGRERRDDPDENGEILGKRDCQKGRGKDEGLGPTCADDVANFSEVDQFARDIQGDGDHRGHRHMAYERCEQNQQDHQEQGGEDCRQRRCRPALRIRPGTGERAGVGMALEKS
ncbi:hypothetical protein Q4543_09975 [Salipiger sp. 1_MG-2023]|nr:hypothetical protein [Salipiger sp. 1_MG-2023]MDO6585847.1 hypothetical protein [Salipiger sp. 1_MG-2023]